jgi:hypothetical protein
VIRSERSDQSRRSCDSHRHHWQTGSCCSPARRGNNSDHCGGRGGGRQLSERDDSSVTIHTHRMAEEGIKVHVPYMQQYVYDLHDLNETLYTYIGHSYHLIQQDNESKGD